MNIYGINKSILLAVLLSKVIINDHITLILAVLFSSKLQSETIIIMIMTFISRFIIQNLLPLSVTMLRMTFINALSLIFLVTIFSINIFISTITDMTHYQL